MFKGQMMLPFNILRPATATGWKAFVLLGETNQALTCRSVIGKSGSAMPLGQAMGIDWSNTPWQACLGILGCSQAVAVQGRLTAINAGTAAGDPVAR